MTKNLTKKLLTSTLMAAVLFTCHQMDAKACETEIVPFVASENSEYTEDEQLLARLVIAEAENQTLYGKQLVASSVLNRLDAGYGDSIREIIYAKNQFECVSNGRYMRVIVDDAALELARAEIKERTDNKVMHFRTLHYHTFGTPYLLEDDHYFSY